MDHKALRTLCTQKKLSKANLKQVRDAWVVRLRVE